MSSTDASKATYVHAPERFLSAGTNHTSPNESTASTRTTEISINGNSYVNAPSPSSITSSSTLEHPLRYRPCSSRNENHGPISSRRRFRHDRLFHHTHSLNRQYVVTMTNILFQMQREIYRLRRRAGRVEQTVAKHMQYAHPIIRIPRLTRDELSSAALNVKSSEEFDKSEIAETPKPSIETTTTSVVSPDKPSSRVEDEQEQENSPSNEQQSPPKTKYCSLCKHDYSTRSAYLQHMRKIHQEKFPKRRRGPNRIRADSFNNQTTLFNSDQSVLFSDVENDQATHFLVNPWDLGEGRLRPRRLSKVGNGPSHKVQCDVCHKFYHGTYIKKHKQNKHEKPSLSSPHSDTNELVDTTESILEQQAYEMISNPDECTMNESNDPPSGLTIAEMDLDDEPIRFPIDTSKPIIFATTCLERYQLDIVEQFLQKFPSRASRASTINSATTHLVINDDKHPLRSPVTLKLVEAIADHCYCVSYRWLLECVRYDRIVEESPFEIEGDNLEINPHGGPQRSRLSDPQQPLFHNICFMIKCTENTESNITNDHLRSLIEKCGGSLINCVTKRLLDTHSIVVLCDQTYVSERRHNYDQCHSLGIHFVSSQWVIQSIVEFRAKPFTAYEEAPL